MSTASGATGSDDAMAGDEVVFVLDHPHYHHLRRGGRHALRGLALALRGPAVEAIEGWQAGQRLARIPVELPSPELAALVPLAGAARCRFAGEAPLAGEAAVELLARRASGETLPVFALDLEHAARRGDWLERAAAVVQRLPAPSPELVEATQGGRDVAAYRDSIVSGAATLEALLGEAGVAASGVGDVLDIGCGTGRLLVGHHLLAPERRLTGVDLDPRLVGWARRELPGLARWLEGRLAPPLDLPASSFDLVQLVSVLTHLPLDLQHAWLEEIGRLLRPGGVLLVTLHGPVYAELLLDAAGRDAFATEGYFEVAGGPAGSNPFATFHAPVAARRLLAPLGSVQRFPRGAREGVVPSRFPLAALQDVYLVRRR